MPMKDYMPMIVAFIIIAIIATAVWLYQSSREAVITETLRRLDEIERGATTPEQRLILEMMRERYEKERDSRRASH